MDKIKFANDDTYEILRVIGGPQVIDGVERDVLRIEAPVNSDYLTNAARDKFNNPDLTKKLRFECEDGTTYDIGDGYCMFLTDNLETRRVVNEVGVLKPDEMERVYVITIAQLTYQEMVDRGLVIENG